MNHVDIPKKKIFEINYSQFDGSFPTASIPCLGVQYAFVNRKALIFYAKNSLNASIAFCFVLPNVTKATQSRMNTSVLMTPYSSNFLTK